jgi:hypothetical protein
MFLLVFVDVETSLARLARLANFAIQHPNRRQSSTTQAIRHAMFCDSPWPCAEPLQGATVTEKNEVGGRGMLQ